jgi:hypothetical protein
MAYHWHTILPYDQYTRTMQPNPQVDNTIYAPLSPTYPSAVAALRGRRGMGWAMATPVDSADPGAYVQAAASPPAAHPTSIYAPPGAMRQAEALAYAERAFEQAAIGSGSAGVAGGTGQQQQSELTCGQATDTSTPLSVQNLPPNGRARPGAQTSPSPQCLEAVAVPPLPAANGLQPPRVPLAVVGSGLGGDCAPRDANFRQFYGAAQGPAWEVSLQNAGAGSFNNTHTNKHLYTS